VFKPATDHNQFNILQYNLINLMSMPQGYEMQHTVEPAPSQDKLGGCW